MEIDAIQSINARIFYMEEEKKAGAGQLCFLFQCNVYLGFILVVGCDLHPIILAVI